VDAHDNKRRNQRYLPVQTQDFPKYKNQDHAYEDPRLQHICPYTDITYYSNGVACRKSSQAHRETASKMHKATNTTVSLTKLKLEKVNLLEQTVALLWGRADIRCD
jgi:hypothetical protein